MIGDVLLQCSFLPRFSIRIRTRYFNDNGSKENVCIQLALLLNAVVNKYMLHFRVNMFWMKLHSSSVQVTDPAIGCDVNTRRIQ